MTNANDYYFILKFPSIYEHVCWCVRPPCVSMMAQSVATQNYRLPTNQWRGPIVQISQNRHGRRVIGKICRDLKDCGMSSSSSEMKAVCQSNWRPRRQLASSERRGLNPTDGRRVETTSRCQESVEHRGVGVQSDDSGTSSAAASVAEWLMMAQKCVEAGDQ